jgi:hypothetical protein
MDTNPYESPVIAHESGEKVRQRLRGMIHLCATPLVTFAIVFVTNFVLYVASDVIDNDSNGWPVFHLAGWLYLPGDLLWEIGGHNIPELWANTSVRFSFSMVVCVAIGWSIISMTSVLAFRQWSRNRPNT